MGRIRKEERFYLNHDVLCVKMARDQVCWLVYVNLTQARVIGEEGTSLEKMSPKDLAVGRPA